MPLYPLLARYAFGTKGDAMERDQSKGREKNAATPGDRPDPATAEKDGKKVGKHERRTAGPDGPDATEVGDTFKR